MSMHWQCSKCWQWVMPGVFHVCPMEQAQPVNQCVCRAPFVPLTAEAVRLIIREELERLQLGKTGD